MAKSVAFGWRNMMACLSGVVAVVGAVVLPFTEHHRIDLVGPVSTGHRRIENDCAFCHSPAFDWTKDLGGFLPTEVSTSAAACQACHAVSGVHNPQELTLENKNCSECHWEHQGNSLTKLEDSFCVNCHRDLQTREGKSKTFADITDFPSHPEPLLLREGITANESPEHGAFIVAELFGALWRDRAAIRFSHRVHMNPLGVFHTSDDRQRKSMKCDDCHQPDGRGNWHPIKFAEHCVDCHAGQLRFIAPLAGGNLDTLVPHDNPETVRAIIRERLLNHIASQPRSDDNQPSPMRGPGDATNTGIVDLGEMPLRPLFPGQRPPVEVLPDEAKWVRKQLHLAEGLLFREKVASQRGSIGCAYCHVVENRNGEVRVVKPEIPNRWLLHTTFRHDRHRTVNCSNCHAGAENSTRSEDVLLPRIETCRQCHGNNRTSPIQAGGGCLTCHTYHTEHGTSHTTTSPSSTKKPLKRTDP